MEEIARLYDGWNDENTPHIEDGELVGYDIDEEVRIELEDGMKLVPDYATGAKEDHVIRVYK